jgi:hypothetical protein
MRRLLFFFAATAAALGCDAPHGGATGTCQGKCDDSAGSPLDGRADPIAAWLRAHGLSSGLTVDADFHQILFDVAAQQGCSAESAR